MQRIPVAGPSITDLEICYVTDAVTRCWYDQANIYHERFEQTFREYVGTRYAIALPSCTSAIHLSLAALGVGPGDEVIVPELTWIATAAPIHYVGATPVFADVDPASWCLSPETIADCLTPRTKAVIVVSLYGNVPRMDEIAALCQSRGIPLIEDAAEALGSQFGGRALGSFGDTGVFSFHGSKTMTTGEGGMLVTSRKDLFDRAHVLRDHGRVPGDVSFFNQEVAFKYKLSSLQAALGLAQIERIEELVARKREIFSWYAIRLANQPGVSLNPEPAGCRNSYWMSTLVLAPDLGISKDQLIRELADHKIDSRPFFHPLSHIPAFRDSPAAVGCRERNPQAYRISQSGINLPSGLSLTESQVDQVCSVLTRFLKSRGRSHSRAA